jgi:sugar phosphate isomerase/epimerase
MSFTFAYSGLQWNNPNLEEKLADLAETGWDGWETRLALDWLGPAKRVKKLCAESGVQVCAVCGPNVTLSTKDHVQEINKRRIEYAADLEVPLFMTKGPGRPDRATTEEDLDRMADVYEDLALYAEPLGVTVTFHPHIGHVVDSSDEWKQFMPRLSACKLCLDMSHAVHWGYDPIQAVHDFKDRIAYIHLHDYDYDKDHTVELGEGPMCDYTAFLTALKDIAFTGWIVACPGNSDRIDKDKMRINRNYLKGLGY